MGLRTGATACAVVCIACGKALVVALNIGICIARITVEVAVNSAVLG